MIEAFFIGLGKAFLFVALMSIVLGVPAMCIYSILEWSMKGEQNARRLGDKKLEKNYENAGIFFSFLVVFLFLILWAVLAP